MDVGGRVERRFDPVREILAEVVAGRTPALDQAQRSLHLRGTLTRRELLPSVRRVQPTPMARHMV